MSTETKAIVRRLYEEVWNKRRLEVANEVISPSHALHDQHLTGSAVGPEAYKRVCTQFIAAFPDLRFTVEDYISEKDRVVACWTISGTHKRAFRGIPATNKKISVEGVTINHIANGKIMDSYVNVDYLGMMQQLGVAPLFGQPKGAAAR
ncbi:MAG: ester cyclase [Candidatus Acidiferrum sp.]